MTVKLATEAIRTIALFEKVTKVHAKDCLITNNSIYFLVDESKVGLAVGKNGSQVRELRRMFRKQIRLFGYSEDPETLIRNMIPGLKNIRLGNGSAVVSVDPRERLPVIGKSGENINAVRELLKRHCSIVSLKLKV